MKRGTNPISEPAGKAAIPARKSGRGPGMVGLVFALGLGACASTGTANRPGAGEPTQATVERLRAENAGQARKVEELENQVFILTSELEARRKGEPPPVALPEVKLSRSEPEPTANSGAGTGPTSLVDEAEIEYAGAAAERGSGKRPVLKIWGASAETSETEASSAPTSEPASNGRNPRRAALGRRPPHPPLSPAARAPAKRELAAREPAPESARVPKLPAAPPRAAPATKPDQATDALYQTGLLHLRAGRHDEAVDAFRGFVAANPKHDLADNAQYWLGECFYDRKDYSSALREFRRVVSGFGSGNKVPDALLKLGLSYLGLGSTRPGQEALSDLVRRFPQHPAATLAQARLGELKERPASAAPVLGAAVAGQEVR